MPLKLFARYTVQHLRFRRSVPFILAGAVHDIQTNDSRDTGMSRLRRLSDLCSSMLSDTAYQQGHGNTLCFPTVEKILCRSPISQRSHIGNLRQTLQGKGEIHKRVETAGVYPLVRPRGVSALPAEVQRKTPRPLGANTLTQFASPGQPVPKNRLRGSHFLGCPYTTKTKKAPLTRCLFPSVDMSAAQQQQLPQLPQPPQVLSPQVPQEPQPPLP